MLGIEGYQHWTCKMSDHRNSPPCPSGFEVEAGDGKDLASSMVVLRSK